MIYRYFEKTSFLVKVLASLACPMTGFMIGSKLDQMESERLSRFRDKSALYRRDIPPATPSW